MRLNTITTYTSIFVVGGIIIALSFNAGNDNLGYLSLFITTYLVVFLRFFLEWRYYRRHRSIIASLEFVLLPFSILALGQLTTSKMGFQGIVNISFTLFNLGTLHFYLNLISLSLFPPLLLINRIFSNYHTHRWDGFAILRRLFRSRRMPYLVNLILVILMLVLGTIASFDLISSLMVLTFINHTIKFYLLEKYRGIRMRTRQLERLVTNSDTVQGTTPRQRTRNYNDPIPTVSRNGQRVISQSTGQRQIPTTSRKRTSHVQVAPATELKNRKKVSQITKEMRPSGNVTHEDLACMFCYSEIRQGDKDIILCPVCRYPGHEDEYKDWVRVSNLCARCSKPFNRYPKYVIPAKLYYDKVVSKL